MPRRHFVDAWFLFTASPNLNRALLQFLTVSDFRLHIAALLHSNRMTNLAHDTSLPFCRHNDAIRTNKPHPFNEIRIVLDSASRTLSEVAEKDVEDLMLAGPGPAHTCRSMIYKPCGAGLRPARDFLRSLPWRAALDPSSEALYNQCLGDPF